MVPFWTIATYNLTIEPDGAWMAIANFEPQNIITSLG